MINLEKLKGILFLFQVSVEKHLQLKKYYYEKIKHKFSWMNKLFFSPSAFYQMFKS